jgi:ribosomal protein S18 acetylase RimI-like enzyme
MSSIAILRADVSHAAAIASIGRKSFRDAFGHLFPNREELTEYLEHTYGPVKLANSLRKENNMYLLARVKGQPVGFAKIKKQSLNQLIESPLQMELQKIYVLTKCQGMGIGSALMKEVKQIAKEINPGYIWLDAHMTNEKAIRFYEEKGFVKTGKHFFTIGRQVFGYYIMQLPVEVRSFQPAH